ncbi:hypothetical protein VNI00_007350 [Paramarasmius palmivorus]|uniref:CxC2-like cysteine cluster KDZ transposase-associated domain-containing protein n=1 Tax=Paramarasmius palmivorus TaxID=297713 RepID=A0AAW0CZW5_9AGAR
MPKTSRNKRDNKRFSTSESLQRPEKSITSTARGIIAKNVDVKISTHSESSTGPANAVSEPSWEPFDMVSSSEMLNEEYGDSEPPLNEEPGRVKVKKSKAKRYEDSDTPLLSWLEKHREEYLAWSFASEGRGRLHKGGCVTEGCLGDAIHRCLDCVGYGMFCKKCILRNHGLSPCHRVQTWKNHFFIPTTLRELGLCVQFGHLGGQGCNKFLLVEKFVVLDVNGIHVIDAAFCGCSEINPRNQLLEFGFWPMSYKDPQSAVTFNLLRNFHLMNLKGHIPPTDYYRALERMSNGDGLHPPPDRLHQFRTVIREWRHIKMGRRSGRGHDTTGLSGTPNGGTMVLCRACPHPGINLPQGWEDAPKEMQFLYALLVSIDANFKQKARSRPGDKNDPVLGPGFGCFVPNEPYMEEINRSADQDEISHCVTFSAIWNANNKKSRGLRATGVGSVVCSRHGMFRPNGMGDLQKGERYINMDCIFLMTLISCGVMVLYVTYDIACQWGIKFFERMSKRPSHWHLPQDMSITFKVPKFHLPAHTEKCHAPYALEYTEGVGDTDGEAPERNWAELNVSARSLSMMTSGARFDTTDDICNDWNHEKTLDLANSLIKKLVKAISNLVVYTRAFTAFTEALQHNHSIELQKWEKQVVEWENKRSRYCPYEISSSSINMAQVKKSLADEEHRREKSGENPRADLSKDTSTLTALVIEMLDVEEIQRTLAGIASQSNLSLYQRTDLQNRRTALLKRIRRMRENQFTHMPALRKLIQSTDSGSEPEAVPLYFPSSFTVEVRQSVFPAYAIHLENQLRYAQAFEALSTLRGLLRARTVTYQHSEQGTPSQSMFTKLNALRSQVEVKIRSISGMYRTARAGLLQLRGSGDWEKALKELKAEDVRGIGERVARDEDLETFRKAQKRAGVDPKDVEKILRGEDVELPMIFVDPSATVASGSHRSDNLSWIWYTYGSNESVSTEGVDAKEVEASLRVEWCKARARARRAREEVLLVNEEMRRCIEFCRWKAGWWEQQKGRSDLEAWITEGLDAYASEQAFSETSRAINWNRQSFSIRERAKVIWNWVDNPTDDLEIEMDFDGDEWDV